MSQSDPVIAPNPQGLLYRTLDNAAKLALLSTQKGSSIPSYKVSGMLWLNDSASPLLSLECYDGADSIPMFEINANANLATAYGAQTLRLIITQASHGLTAGNVLKKDTSGGTYSKAQANNEANAIVAGFCAAVIDANTFVFVSNGLLPLSGLTEGAIHYLSADAAGALTTTPPAIARPVLLGLSGSMGIVLAPRPQGLREKLSQDRTYYVRTDGSDSNNGLANTSGGAFLTVQKAINVACMLDLGDQNVIIQLADGTFAESLTLKSFVGDGRIRIQGNNTTPSNVLIAPASGTAITQSAVRGVWDLRDFKITANAGGGRGILCDNFSRLVYRNLEFGTCADAQIFCIHGARVNAEGNYKSVGNATAHIYISDQANVETAGVNLTFENSPAFSYAFLGCDRLAEARMESMTFGNIGTVTGTRVQASMNAIVVVGGAGATYLPGNGAVNTTSGAQYL